MPMKDSLHVEGMGVLGCMLAWGLYLSGQNFSWHDNEQKVNSWGASTGGIYPAAVDEREWNDYLTWYHWANSQAFPWRQMIGDCVEAGRMIFNHKLPPHKSNARIVDDFGALRTQLYPSFHLNVKMFVALTRQFFSYCRTEGDSPSDVLVRAHGFTERLTSYYWGWNVPVVLNFDHRVLAAGWDGRYSVYIRPNKFELSYAYPLAGTALWLAGGGGVSSKEPREQNVKLKLDKWDTTIRKYSKGLVYAVAQTGENSQGWRPVERNTDGAIRFSLVNGRRVLTYPPMGPNGVRLSSSVTNEALQLLNLAVLPNPEVKR